MQTMTLYELLIRGTADGNIVGSHVINFDDLGRTGQPQPINAGDWPELAVGINAALSAQIANLQAELSAMQTIEQSGESIAHVTPRQFRLALIGIGISPASISAMLADDEVALTEWDYAQEIRRDHPLVEVLRLQLGKSSEDVDALFVAAASL